MRDESNELYIRSTLRMFRTPTWFFCGNIFFSDGWKVAIRVGVFTPLGVVYILIMICLGLHSIPDVIFVALVTSLLIGGRVIDYLRLRRILVLLC